MIAPGGARGGSGTGQPPPPSGPWVQPPPGTGTGTQPPPGPGVQPPFVAAPVEGRRARLGLGLGVAGGLLALCCGAGGAATVGLLVLGERAVNEQAQRAAEDYLGALVEREWEQAYEQRCAADREAESLDRFRSRMSAGPRITGYDVGELRIETGGDPLDAGELTVPADVAYADGTDTVLEIPLEQNPETGQFEVCGQFIPE